MPSKKSLYEAGVSAAQCAELATDVYICPICQDSFGAMALQNGILTAEHVPPKSLGGRAIILTCKSCNNSSGYRFEGELKNKHNQAAQAKAIVSRQGGVVGHVFLGVGNTRVNANLTVSERGMSISLSHRHNDPASLSTFSDDLSRFVGGETLSITSRYKFFPSRAKLAELKASFLTLTSKFGYSYAFSPVGNEIRNIILSGDDQNIPMMYVDRFAAEQEFDILVDLGQATVVLRLVNSYVALPLTKDCLADRFSENSNGKHVHFSGINFPMPKSFEAILDRFGNGSGAISELKSIRIMLVSPSLS